jgi:hypothetical protein
VSPRSVRKGVEPVPIKKNGLHSVLPEMNSKMELV